jgi:hypothetical protein
VTHAEFIAAYRRGALTIQVDRKAAARFLSGRLLLPLVTLPFLGIGVGLALLGWLYSGLAVIAFGMIAPRLVKWSAGHFLLIQALEDEALYREIVAAGILRVADGAPGSVQPPA